MSFAEQLASLEAIPGQVQALFSALTMTENRIKALEKRSGTTPNISEISQAVAAFQSLGIIVPKGRTVNVKDRQGKQLYSFKYATYDTICERIQPMLGEQGLAFSHTMQPAPDGSFVAMVRTTLMHQSGQQLHIDIPVDLQAYYEGKPQGRMVGIQDMGSSITYAKRYGLSALLGIAVDDDDDGNTASGNVPEIQDKKTEPVTSEQATTLTALASVIEDKEPGFTNKYLTHLRIGSFEELAAVRFEPVHEAMSKRAAKGDETTEGDSE